MKQLCWCAAAWLSCLHPVHLEVLTPSPLRDDPPPQRPPLCRGALAAAVLRAPPRRLRSWRGSAPTARAPGV
jgi:hypothetical protein